MRVSWNKLYAMKVDDSSPEWHTVQDQSENQVKHDSRISTINTAVNWTIKSITFTQSVVYTVKRFLTAIHVCKHCV